MNNSFAGVRNQNQEVSVAKENLPEDFEAMGIRLIATSRQCKQMHGCRLMRSRSTKMRIQMTADDSELSVYINEAGSLECLPGIRITPS